MITLNQFSHEDLVFHKIKLINNIKKVSFYNFTDITIYELKYLNDDLQKIRLIIKEFSSKIFQYKYIKNDEILTGNYNDILTFSEKADLIYLELHKYPKTPNIIYIINDIFRDIEIKIVKKCLYSVENKNRIELIDLYE